MTDDLSVAGVKIPPAVRTAGVAAASGAAVVVVRQGKPIAVLTRSDLLEYLAHSN